MNAALIGEEVEARLRRAASRVAVDLGLELVELRIGRARKRWHIRLDIERVGPTGVGIDDCQRVSREVDSILEEQDLVPGSYVLEVSSPGIDRPIRTADDYRRNAGRRVVIETREPVEGQRRFAGVLRGSEGGVVTIELDGEARVRIPMESVSSARQEAVF